MNRAQPQLPPDLAGQAAQLQMRQQLSQALLGQSMQPTNPMRSSGRYVVPISPLEGLSKMATTALLSKGLVDATKDEAGLYAQSNQRTNAALSQALTDSTPGNREPSFAKYLEPPPPISIDRNSDAVVRGANLNQPQGAPIDESSMVADTVGVGGKPTPSQPAQPTLQDYQRKLMKISQSTGVPLESLLANPIVAAQMKQLEEYGKPQKVGEGETVYGPNGMVIAQGPAKKTEFARMLEEMHNSPNQFTSDAYKAKIAKDSGIKPENIHVDPNTGKAYGVVWDGEKFTMQDLGGAKQTRKLPEGVMLGPDGKEQVDPVYLDSRKQIAASGASNVNLFAPQPGLDAQGNAVFFQPNKQGEAPTIVPGVTPKPPEGYNKQKAGIDSVVNAMEQYKTMLTTNGGRMDRLSPSKRLELGTMYNNMMLQAKEAYNLGVLNGPDYEILQQVIKNPLDMTSQIYSADDLKKQVDTFNQVMGGIRKSIDASYGQKSQAPTPPKASFAKPVIGKAKPAQDVPGTPLKFESKPNADDFDEGDVLNGPEGSMTLKTINGKKQWVK